MARSQSSMSRSPSRSCSSQRPDGSRPGQTLPGIRIITDLQFWREPSEERLEANAAKLLQFGRAAFVEGVNVYTVWHDLCKGTTCFGPQKGRPFAELFPGVTASSITLVIVGGFHPHHAAARAVQALTHQLPNADVVMLYAAWDEVPQHQDDDIIHIQTFTADAHTGYEICAGSHGERRYSRCHSMESRQRGIENDPRLVKVSAFVRNVDNVVLVDGKVSTSLTAQFHLQIGNNILFCGEGGATLAASAVINGHVIQVVM